MSKLKLPKYVKLETFGTALILREDRYYRHAGHWYVGAIMCGGKLVSVNLSHPLIHNKPLMEITEEEWRRGNEPYINR